MSSETELCNIALALVGAEEIRAFDTDTSNRAVRCRTLYPAVRDRLQAMFRWNFNMTRIALGGATAETPAYGFTYAYNLPSDFLSIWETSLDLHPQIAWKIEGDQLLTDGTGVSILYSYRVEPVSVFPAGFHHALALQLAADLSIPIMRDRAMRQQYQADAAEALLDALATEGQQGTPDQPANLELIIPRLTNAFSVMPITHTITDFP